MHRNALCSLINFIRGFIIIILPNLFQKFSSYRGDFTLSYCVILFLFTTLVGVYLRLKYDEIKFQIAVRSYFLGVVFSCGVFGLLASVTRDAGDRGKPAAVAASLYLTCLAAFHFTEYAVFALVNSSAATVDSFLLDHSAAYKFALAAGCLEFAAELYFFPWIKSFVIPIGVGMVMIAGGDALRKIAMVTASVNFDHYIQYTKRPGHTLVTNGVYAWSRHPSYVGWFYWSIGTQILLSNPLCSVLYAVVGWRFFSERIENEELTLLKFFGKEYHRYRRDVPVRLPFIAGYDSSFMDSALNSLPLICTWIIQ